MSGSEEQSNKGEDGAPHAELREWVFGTLPTQKDQDSPAHEWAGEIDDPDVRAYMSFAAEVIEDKEVFDEFQKSVRGIHTTEAVHQAVQTGNMARAAYFSGLVGYKKDVSGMKALMSLLDLIENTPVFIAYVFGAMGHGKTNFTMLMLQCFIRIYGRENLYLTANLTSDDLDEEVTKYSRIVELLESRREKIQAGEDVDELVIVVDEAAQELTGSGKDQHQAKVFAKLLKLARKAKAHIIFIGQDGKDIGPSLRSLCTMFLHKESEKTAVIYRDVKDRQGIGKLQTLSKVPETDIGHSTWDEGEFDFDTENIDVDEEDEITEADIKELETDHERETMAILATSTEMKDDEVGDLYDVSGRTVRRAKKEYEDKLQNIGLIEG